MSCGNSASTNGFFYGTTNPYSSMPVHNWYYSKYGDLANRYGSAGKVKLDDFLKKYEKSILYKDTYFDKELGRGEIYCCIIQMDNHGTIAYVEDCNFDKKQSIRKGFLNIFYNKQTLAYDYAIKYIAKHKVQEDKKGIINLICKTANGGFELKEYSIKNPDIDFNINYNEGFKDIDKIILEKLNEENGKGLVMLYGEPGTGKTSYIRRIINNVRKRVLYLPPDMATELSNPGLVPFLTDIPNSILIVEDAENVLIKRQGQHNQAISNILNLSDGLIGDCLSIQIVATFNTNLSNIDEALMRKGRLIAKYEFKQLTSDRVKRLARKLGVKFDKDSGTIAEIYNAEDMDFSKTARKAIGFKNDNGVLENESTGKKISTPKNSRKKIIVNNLPPDLKSALKSHS